jgi:hypothetical protein
MTSCLGHNRYPLGEQRVPDDDPVALDAFADILVERAVGECRPVFAPEHEAAGGSSGGLC